MRTPRRLDAKACRSSKKYAAAPELGMRKSLFSVTLTPPKDHGWTTDGTLIECRDIGQGRGAHLSRRGARPPHHRRHGAHPGTRPRFAPHRLRLHRKPRRTDGDRARVPERGQRGPDGAPAPDLRRLAQAHERTFPGGGRHRAGVRQPQRRQRAQARSGARGCAVRVPQGMPVFEYAPRAIKLAVVGSGRRRETQVAHMIKCAARAERAPRGGCGRASAVRRVPCAYAEPRAARAARRGARLQYADDRFAARPHRRQSPPTTHGRGRRRRLRAGSPDVDLLSPAGGGRAQVHLLTHLVVREDAHVLYGFATEDERRLFRT